MKRISVWMVTCLICSFKASKSTSTPRGGYIYSATRCSPEKHSLLIKPSSKELSTGVLAPFTINEAVETFRHCGVLAISPGIKNQFLLPVDNALNQSLAPLLASRQRIRDRLRHALATRGNLRAVFEDVEDELLLASGDILRERDDGRLDQRLIVATDQGDSMLIQDHQVLAPSLIVGLLASLLGDGAELKSGHAIHSLAGAWHATGREPQHWHRDAGLLFEKDNHFHVKNAHDRAAGAHLPPYAINVFVPLEDLTEQNGPTEFTLGSHLWGDVWAEDEESEGDHLRDHFFKVPRGTLILADYRTVHRGTVNHSNRTRTLLMFIYGRDWWEDRVNYGSEDYGGAGLRSNAVSDTSTTKSLQKNILRRQLGTQDSTKVGVEVSASCDGPTFSNGEAEKKERWLRERMFWSLTNLWEAGMIRELQLQQRA